MKNSKPFNKMVYYFISGNVKMVRNLLLDYGSATDIAPNEYMKSFIEKCPEDTEDSKLAWVAETFLGIQKHDQFLRDIARDVSQDLSDEDRDYFMILFHAVIFQINPKEMQFLYRCLFNLSKPLLETFIKFLSSDEVLAYLSQVAQTYYDAHFITQNILRSLFAWQPHIIEMTRIYADYVKKMESRKVKPPTVPIQPNVLNRRRLNSANRTTRVPPPTPPNPSKDKPKRITSRSVIDDKLKERYEKNKQKANQLLNDVKTKECHYALVKSDTYFRKLASIKEEMENSIKPLLKLKPTYSTKKVCQPVKETAANIKRIKKRIQMAEQEEVQWFHNVINCRNTAKIEELQEFDRQENERERLLDIEKKHLKGQISYEQALLAKQKVVIENKKKYEEFLKEKEMWNDEIEKWKENEMKKNRKSMENQSLTELNILQAKHNIATKNKEAAERIRKQNQILLEKAIKAKQDELDRKVKMIKEFKILASIAKKTKVPKVIDLTETSGFGLLCEMSMAELQERVNAVKICLNDQLEQKRNKIKSAKEEQKEELEETKKSIESFMSARAMSRKKNKRATSNTTNTSSKEVDDLKKTLEEKRKLRLRLTK